MDFVKNGRKYNSSSAHEEMAWCSGLIREYPAELENQGIEARMKLALEELDHRLRRQEQGFKDSQARLQAITDRVNRELNEGVSLLGQAWNYCRKAFELSQPEVLERFPSRTKAQRSLASMTSGLGECSALVKEYHEALAKADAPADLGQKLEHLNQQIISTNQVQEIAKQECAKASDSVAACRGEIYYECGRVYEAGRIAFRRQSDIRSNFCFHYMSRTASSSSSDSAAKKEETTASATATP